MSKGLFPKRGAKTVFPICSVRLTLLTAIFSVFSELHDWNTSVIFFNDEQPRLIL